MAGSGEWRAVVSEKYSGARKQVGDCTREGESKIELFLKTAQMQGRAYDLRRGVLSDTLSLKS